MTVAYDEIVDFIAGRNTPQSVVDFRPSDETRAHVADLIRRQKAESLSADETAELNHYLQIEHLMRLAKARARQRLAAGDSACPRPTSRLNYDDASLLALASD